MIEANIFCEKCRRFLGIMLNPIHLRGYYCHTCKEKLDRKDRESRGTTDSDKQFIESQWWAKEDDQW